MIQFDTDPMSPEAIAKDINVIPMNFRIDFKPKRDNPTEFEETHHVDLVKKGTLGESTPYSIKMLKRDPVLWPYVKPYYDRWREGQDPPVNGTALEVLPFLPRAIVEHLKHINLKTAEDLADAEESVLERIGMGARGWREKARSYLKAKDGVALVATANAELTAQVESQQAEIDELREQVNALVSDKPRRGRPRKAAGGEYPATQ